MLAPAAVLLLAVHFWHICALTTVCQLHVLYIVPCVVSVHCCVLRVVQPGEAWLETVPDNAAEAFLGGSRSLLLSQLHSSILSINILRDRGNTR